MLPRGATSIRVDPCSPMPQGEARGSQGIAKSDDMGQSFTRFVGVDLGGGKGKKTALAVLERGRDGVTVTRLAPKAKGPPGS